jgi:hypothetical protein
MNGWKAANICLMTYEEITGMLGTKLMFAENDSVKTAYRITCNAVGQGVRKLL